MGVTDPWKLLLERRGVRAHAVFRYVAVKKRFYRSRQDTKVYPYFRDHYANEPAAYALSRLLGLDCVPPVVERSIRGRPGTVQLWLEGTFTERHRQSEELRPPDPVDWHWQILVMRVFDNLINNIDRNQGNLLIARDWKLWWIDHTRAFARGSLPYPERVTAIDRPFWAKLQSVKDEQIREALKPHLGRGEIDAQLERREELVNLIRARIREGGPGKMLFNFRPRSEKKPQADPRELSFAVAPLTVPRPRTAATNVRGRPR